MFHATHRTHRLGGYRAHSPPPDLAPVVDAVWWYAAAPGAAAPIPGRGHRVLPEPGLSLCFRCERTSEGRPLHGQVLVMGPIRSIRFFRPDEHLRLEAVRLNPEWCLDLLGLDPAEHADAIDPLDQVSPRAASRLLDRLMRTAGPGDAARVLLRELESRIAERLPSPSTDRVHQALDHVRRDRTGTPDLAMVARRLGLSERQLRRLVRRTTGAGAKHTHRVHRLNRVIAAADAIARPRWARLALEAGYCDQPHLVRDVRQLSACTPAELHRERRLQQVRPPVTRTGRG